LKAAEIQFHQLLKNLGVEPLPQQFDAVYLPKALKNRKTPKKSALLDRRNRKRGSFFTNKRFLDFRTGKAGGLRRSR
jgi:hypothetical protein